MRQETVCKTIHQYNSQPVSAENMQKLLEIAGDYCKVKNYVYRRYGGTASLSKLYPGYTVQNEMTESGLRGELGLPSVYFYLAIYDALGDIKCQWTRTKTKVLALMNQNERLTDDEKHYLRFLLKVKNAFDAVLQNIPIKLQKDIQAQYDVLAKEVDTAKLHRYLCRQVRKYHVKLHTDKADGFSISERAYRYADHGIYISIKEKRKRIFVPLTDNHQYKSQLYIKLNPKDDSIEIKVPVNVAVRSHTDYANRVGVAFGVFTMLTTDKGHSYGEDLGKYQIEYADWMREQTGIYNRNRQNNSGRKKYTAKKRRFEEQLHSYINHELNCFLKEEKPQTVYIVKLPKPQRGGSAASVNKRINNAITMWQRGYIRNRLLQKCREQSVDLIEVLGKDISRECSRCGAIGNKEGEMFLCESCGCRIEEKTNTAKNVLNRGINGKVLH